VTERYAAAGATLEEMTTAVKSVRRNANFGFKSITVEQKDGFWYFDYEINPRGKKKSAPVKKEKELTDANIKALSDADLAAAIAKHDKGTKIGDKLRYERYLRDRGPGQTPLPFDEWLKVSRGGRSGGPEHQKIQGALVAGGKLDKEVTIGDRVADAANDKEIHQIGGLNERGDPIARERDAIIDIMATDKKKRDIYFHDKKSGKKILVARGGKIVLDSWKDRK
jgi:hypothetical protein